MSWSCGMVFACYAWLLLVVKIWSPKPDSNGRLRFFRPPLLQLSYMGNVLNEKLSRRGVKRLVQNIE